MPWARVDDGLHSHPKVIALGRDLPALALWVLGVSYCAHHRTDGVMTPATILTLVGPRFAKSWPAALVRVRLWERVRGSYRYHDWADYNYDKATLDQRDALNRARQRRYNEKLAREALAQEPETFAQEPRKPNAPLTRYPAQPNALITASLPDPSLPIPTQKAEAEAETSTATPPPAPPPAQIPSQGILDTLDQCQVLGLAPGLRDPAWWTSILRISKNGRQPSYPFTTELLKCDALLVSTPLEKRPPIDELPSYFFRWLERSRDFAAAHEKTPNTERPARYPGR